MRRPWPVLLVVSLFLAALLIRLAAAWLVPETHLGTNAEIAYLGGAKMIVEGKGFRDPKYPVFTPPLYAIVIAASLYVFNDGIVPIRIAQAVADALTVVVLYFIAWHVFGPWTALLSGIGLCVYPFSIYAATYVGTETFFTLLLSIAVLLGIYTIKFGFLRHYLGGGLVLGLATLMRGTTFYCPPVFLVLLWGLGKMNRSAAPKCVAYCLVFALVIFPWSLRNYIVLGEIIPVATTGSVVLQGSAEKFWTISGKISEYPGYFELLKARGIEPPPRATVAEADRFLFRAGLENYKILLETNPLGIVPLMVKKFVRLWYATESGRGHAKVLAINMLIYVPAAVGLVLALRRRVTLAWTIYTVLGYFILLHWLTFPLFRYVLPVMPYLIVLAAFPVASIWRRSDGVAVVSLQSSTAS